MDIIGAEGPDGVGAGVGCDAAEVIGGAEGAWGGAGGARTVKAVVALTDGCETNATSR